ncbi:NAD-dependent epimerase/dehydratase family protein [Desulforamulus ruminis]|uniref:NAD-dependent epimerase/dehydratase n=1 Tax=Desulforamulus ruminis (strain ATCC 23193 / DSM 2154 / NCIMB 8452 / DL) TaxID=696281 RepID=F6DKS4_DESRL|nr:NAD-dependent epimerase/dehydratase family protein [Desulforamulus ruminis]AEG60449.1 NAD-dependent epimerase/dehydratase [Desulforamulus ruminis DSM 2154]
MQRVFVTGGTGFIGYHIAKRLLQNGYNVRLLVHSSRRKLDILFHPKVEVVTGDILDVDGLRQAMRGCGIVYHAAGIVTFNPSLAVRNYAVNVQGTENICRLVLELGIEKLIYTSSAATIGKNPSGLSDETTAFNLWDISSHYKKSKVLAENKVMEFYKNFALPVVIVNPSVPIGTHDFRPSPSGSLVINHLKSKKPLIYAEGGMNFVDVEDVALGHLMAEKKGKVGERYILGNQNLSIYQFYNLLDTVSDKKTIKVKCPYWAALLVGKLSQQRVRHSTREPKYASEGVKLMRKKMFYDVSKARKELGISFTPLENACRKALRWFATEYGRAGEDR